MTTKRNLACLVFGSVVAFAARAAVVAPANAPGRVRNVAIVVYQGVELLDFAGPGEVFAAAGNGAFNVYTVAASADPIVSLGFVKVVPDYSITTSPAPDIVVIPGGNVANVFDDARMMAWIERESRGTEITMSVCNGAIALAKAGLLNGLKATTHYSAVAALRRFPGVAVVPGARFVDNGRILSTQGVSAGIDGALHVVQRLLGAAAAWADAHYMMYPWEPAGLTEQQKAELRPWVGRDWQAVVALYGRKVAANPHDAIALSRLGVAEQQLGEHERAAATLEKALALGAGDVTTLAALGDARFALGRFAEAANVYAEELPLRPPRALPWVELGIAKAWSRAGDKNAAIAALRNSASSGAVDHRTLKRVIKADPDLAVLRGDPRFAALIDHAL
jgi:transcriptional regulator GlxA family with amidase domain